MPYLNSVPFFRGLAWEDRFDLTDCVPRELGRLAAAGEVDAGLLPVVDFFKLSGQFERLGRYGIAVRGRVGSVMLFSRRPLRQLDGARIAVTEQSSTSAVLLRLILETRDRLRPAEYTRQRSPDADALLLIGDEALSFRQTNTQYPFEIDLAFEWWLWQHLPFTFAAWAVRRSVVESRKRQIEAGLARALSLNMQDLGPAAEERAASLGVPGAELKAYLEQFIYRLGGDEEKGIDAFRELAASAGLLEANG